MPQVIWYFDFVSPYSYFALNLLDGYLKDTKIEYRPVLLAGLLNHFGQKGPVEIEPKRKWTYRACLWYARRHRIPFRMPAAHPFNSLPYLRLAIAADASPSAIKSIFRALWTTGANAADPTLLPHLAGELGVPQALLNDARIKDGLRDNTDKAIQRGVFGVPTLSVDDEVFWGSDAIDFAAAYLKDPGILDSSMRAADALPIGAARKLSP
jgi:2-hydroxychromene-2-carboxylate isomerase